MKAVSNEEVVAALLQHGTVQQAAEAAGTSPRTIYDRLTNDDDFKELYANAKTDLLRKAVFSINDKLSEAIRTVYDIMTDENTAAATRLQCAQVIINNAGKFSERLTAAEKTEREHRARLLTFWE